MEELERDERHQLRANLVTMEVAVVRAWDHVFSNDPLARKSPPNRDRVAHALGAMIPVYTFDEEKKQIHRMTYEDLRMGNFSDGGRKFRYRTGQEVDRIAVDASELPGALARLMDLRGLLEELMR